MSRSPHKQPYVRFFASDWLAGTRGMRAAEVGVYITMIAMMYERCEPLPEDHKRLSRQCGCTTKAFQNILESLVFDEKIIRHEGGLWNKRVEKEFVFRQKKSSTNREAAEKRWGKSSENNDPSVQTQCQDDAKSMPYQIPKARSQKESNTPSHNAREFGSFISPDWEPDDRDMMEAGTYFDPERIKTEVRSFKDHYEQRSGEFAKSRNWSKTFHKWIRNSVERDAKDRAHGKTPGQSSAEKRVADFEAGAARALARFEE